MWAFAIEGCHTVMAGRPRGTGCAGTVINVLTAVLASPTINTDTVVATIGVMAGATILTGIRHQLAFIHIFGAVLTWETEEKR